MIPEYDSNLIWREEELQKWAQISLTQSKTLSIVDHFSIDAVKNLYSSTVSTATPYNITPLTGRTGIYSVSPNSFPFYSEHELYQPKMQSDGGQLSEWTSMYNPTKEQAEIDRAAAVASGIPHCYVPMARGIKFSSEPKIKLSVISEIHEDNEYGSIIDTVTNRHSGGPFTISVPISVRVDELRLMIRDQGGIIPAICRLSYAGKHFEDGNRNLAHYGVGFWSQRFPHWPLKVIGI